MIELEIPKEPIIYHDLAVVSRLFISQPSIVLNTGSIMPCLHASARVTSPKFNFLRRVSRNLLEHKKTTMAE
jgi:hypothetical protein